MTVLAIEINDVGLRAARSGAGSMLALDGEGGASPGFACIDGKSIITGAAAAAQACLRPLVTHAQFWDRLGTEPIASARSRGPTRAAVAIAHLRHALSAIRRDDDDVVMSVPPTYDRRQLGVLVSMARELKLRLRGLVASPVALELDAQPSGRILVVEMSLHRSALSVLDVGSRVELDRTEPCPGIGLQAFRRQWINAIGAEFVRKTRFDPLHDAATEQQLLDRLPDILAGVMRDGSIELDLQAGPHAHRVTITESLLAQSGHSLMFDLGAAVQAVPESVESAAIVLTHDAAGVPGLSAILRQQGPTPVRQLDAGAAARGLCRLWPERFEHPEADGVAYHTWRHP